MIKQFVMAWENNKSQLEKHIKTHNQDDFSYEWLLKALIDVVINPFYKEEEWNSEKIHTIDDGHWQGSQLFIVPLNTYQPSPYQYFWTHVDYGSCSGCDTLEGIRHYDKGFPNEEQVNEYMILALHLLQHCRMMIDKDAYFQDFKD